ncbi:hypothetical protein HN51_035819 [Arachis hypogaea]|uniref:OVATE domain-containing protein n=1 Tax=Arachis hypogaea TaxID=3818 RepID=A0A445A2U1_ARAHY|nr:uncharacterized protein LOC107632942 [Arachis ipaensis]XP_025644190.1 uncharacterized protein LOC112738112 [Arachis hypogaea]QHO01014.1 uncharacterized protein DS421_13g411310 [Arachis hypogaea]RYR20763.1 hypothetical protein Ahy_B03g065996 [Arachis hypogaea]
MVAQTKELFQKALRNFKSFFFCPGYQKLPKNPPPRTRNTEFSFSTVNYDSDFTRHCDSLAPSKLKKKQPLSSSHQKQHNNEGMLEKKLRELEMLETKDRVEHVLDIEEVLHYYSRLKCPFYIEIVDKFFMEIYTDFFASHVNSPPCIVNSNKPNQLP